MNINALRNIYLLKLREFLLAYKSYYKLIATNHALNIFLNVGDKANYVDN